MMNIYQCERYAQENGFDSVEFEADFPAGTLNCKWLDAYMGLFLIHGLGDRFVTTRQMDDMYPNFQCRIKENTDD